MLNQPCGVLRGLQSLHRIPPASAFSHGMRRRWTAMLTHIRILALWASTFVVAAGIAAAEDRPLPGLQFTLSGQAPPGAAAAGTADATYTITLKEAILLALKNNLDITIEGFNPRLREMDIATAKATFDPVFTGSVNAQRSRFRSNTATFIQGSLVSSDTRTFNFNFQLNDKLPTGATAQLAWTNQRLRTNSVSTLFNPSYVPALTLSVTQPLLKNFGIDINTTPIKLAL